MAAQESGGAGEGRPVRALVDQRQIGPGEGLVVAVGHAFRGGEPPERAAEQHRGLAEIRMPGQIEERRTDVLLGRDPAPISRRPGSIEWNRPTSRVA